MACTRNALGWLLGFFLLATASCSSDDDGGGSSGNAGTGGSAGSSGGGAGGGTGGGSGSSGAAGGDGGSIVDLLHSACVAGTCPVGLTPMTYCGFAGCPPEFCSCEIPCTPGASGCPEGTSCISISDGPGNVCG